MVLDWEPRIGGGTLNAPLVNYYEHGLTFARSLEFYNTTLLWQWLRIPGDVAFAIAALLMAYDFAMKFKLFFSKSNKNIARQ